MSNRVLRVRELLKRELSGLISKEFDFNVLVTINDVDITPDLKQAHVFVGMIGPTSEQEAVMEKLVANRGMLQNRMMKRVVLKYTPTLHFKLDDSVERGSRIIDLMDEIPEPSDPKE